MAALASADGVALATGTFASQITPTGLSVSALGPLKALDALSVQGKYIPAAPASGQTPQGSTQWTLWGGSTTGGGLIERMLQGFQYQDGVYGTATQQWLQAYNATIVAGAVGPPLVQSTGRVVCRIVSSAPLDWVSAYPVAGAGSTNLMGSFVGTGAAQVVPCVGITTNAVLRYYLLGATQAAFAAAGGIAAPSALSIQTNASFTITATTGATYGYEVLNA